MSHYDYLRAPPSSVGLAGPVEDAFALAIRAAKLAGVSRADAFDMFRFGRSGLTDAQRVQLRADHAVTPPYDVLFRATATSLLLPGAALDPKKASVADKKKIHDHLYYNVWAKMWEEPAAPSVASRPALLNIASGMPRIPVNIQDAARRLGLPREAEKGFPVVPVVIAASAAVLGAFLLLRKRK